MIDKILKVIWSKRSFLITLVVLSLFSYLVWRIQYVVNPKADQGYLDSKRNPANTSNKIQIKDSVKSQIEQLQDTPLNLQPGQLGTSDPFNP